MNSLLRRLMVVSLVVGIVACSDDDVKNDTGGVADKGVDTGQTDKGQPDTSQPDTGQPDTGQLDSGQPDTGKPDAAQADTGAGDAAVGDGGAIAASCATLVKTCGSSVTWPQYIKPFTAANCVKVVSGVDKLYTGTCSTTFKSLVTCLSGITSSTQCDTKCATQISYLTTNCTCPSACGVPCP